MAIGSNATDKLPRRINRLSSASRLSAISGLSARLSHDLNHILAAVAGHLELAERRLGDRPNEQARIRKAVSAAWQGQAVSQQIATFATPPHRSQEPLPIDAVLHRSCERLRSLGRNVQSPAPLPLWPVTGDESRLEAVVLGLMLAATQDDGATRVSARNKVLDSSPAGDYVCISVAGSGLAAHSKSRSESDAFGNLAVDAAVVFAETLGGHVRLQGATEVTDAECWVLLPTDTA